MVSSQHQWPEFLLLRGLANVLTLLLAFVGAAITARVVIQTAGLCFLAIAGVMLISVIHTVSYGPVCSPLSDTYA